MVALEVKSAGEIAAAEAAKNPLVNELEFQLSHLPQLDLPLSHHFTPGMYSRSIFMPRGAIVISKIHKTEHQYIVSVGEVAVWIEGVGNQTIKAPYLGITKAGTRRVLIVLEDTVWTTFHPTEKTDLAEIEEELIYPHGLRDIEFAENTLREIEGGMTQ